MKKIYRMLLISFLVAFFSNFHMNFFVDGFIITLSIIVLPIALFLNKDLNYLLTCILIAIISPFFRGIIEFTSQSNLYLTFKLIAPDTIFYLIYGIVFQIYSEIENDYSKNYFFVFVFLSDLISNIFEMSFRINIINFNFKIINFLFLIALIRSLIVFSLVISLKYYKSFLKKEEHEKRYQELILLNAYFKSEIYFMNKNMAQIEKIMKKSYLAQKKAKKTGHIELQETLLDISKDIHEVKKDYKMVISGLETIKSKEYKINHMDIKDIFIILKNSLMDHESWYDFYIHFKYNKNISIKKHFLFTSILRNLINNSIEAINKKESHIYIETKINNNKFICTVKDNGSGIKEKNLPYIFNPGFSNKFNENSGEAQRGLGLTLVKDIINKEFNGKINIFSIENKATCFTLEIPLKEIRR